MASTALAPAPTPVMDSSGAIRLPIPSSGLAYDSSRNLVWATVPGYLGQIGNSVIAIDPQSGNVTEAIYAGSEPSKITLSTDGSRLFTILDATWTIGVIDPNGHTRVAAFSVREDQGLWVPRSILGVPSQNNSLIVARTKYDPSSHTSSVAVFDGGEPRQQSFDSVNDLSKYLDTVFTADTPASFFAVDTDFGPSDVYRMIVDGNGVHSGQHLGAIQSGYALALDQGNLYTTGGQMFTADASRLLKSFASGGIPVPFSDRNLVAFVEPSAVTLFDLNTMRPVGMLALPSSTSSLPPIPNVSAARAGSSTLVVSNGVNIFLIPLSSIPAWPVAYSTAIQSPVPGVQSINLPVNAVTALPGTSKLVFSTPSTDGDIGNSIVIFNPATGLIENTIFAGSEPTLLAPSTDGSSVWVALSGELNVARVNFASGQRDLVFAPDPNGGSNQYPVFDMAVGQDGGLAISYYGGPIAIFDKWQAAS